MSLPDFFHQQLEILETTLSPVFSRTPGSLVDAMGAEVWMKKTGFPKKKGPFFVERKNMCFLYFFGGGIFGGVCMCVYLNKYIYILGCNSSI